MEYMATADRTTNVSGLRPDTGPGASDPGPGPPAPPGRLAANLMHFARTLRAAGLPVGSGAVLDALRAVEAVGLARRDDF